MVKIIRPMTNRTEENSSNLIGRCIAQEEYAWEDFVDAFMKPILLTISETAKSRNISLGHDDKGKLCEAVFRSFRYNDFQLLREFDQGSSATTYLSVLARRLVVGFLKVR